MTGVTPHISNIGSMSVACPYCGARSWPNEKISCCAAGDVQLPGYPAIPVELTSVILSAHVRQNIRLYNMSLAMASVGHRAAGLPDGMFVLGGQACHRIGSLAPSPGCPPAFAQIYVLDADAAALRRMQVFGRDCPLKRDVLRSLHELLIQHNPCVRQFVAAARSDVPRFSWSCFDDISGMQVGAMVMEPGERRDIVVQRVSGPLMFIHDGHSLFHPLSYPLLFPLGTHGWRESLHVMSVDCRRVKRVTLTEWGRYYLMHRDEPTHVQRCEKLALEYYCDMWAQQESRVCHFHRSPVQQAKYRAARVAAFEDQLSAGIPAAEIGQPVVRLPSSVVGSARFYQQLYLDAMALPRKFGKPDIFLTFTCNPNWPEVRDALPVGAHWRFHPDIVARAFMLKLKELMHDIVINEIFGTMRAYVYRIEWQVRCWACGSHPQLTCHAGTGTPTLSYVDHSQRQDSFSASH